MNDLRRALVTGGGSGIGAAVVSALRSTGVDVTVWDINGEDGASRVDVASWPEVTQAAALLPSSLDLVVTCAGVAVRTSVVDTSADDWDRVVAINLNGTLYTAQSTYTRLVAGQGTLVTIGSVAATVPIASRAAYCASKAGVVMLTKCLGNEWGPDGVRVVCVSPGFVDGGMARRGLDAGGTQATSLFEHTPLGRLVEMEEVVSVILAAGSPGFGGVTGTEIVVDAGFNAGLRL